jgi:hypothetical protein
MASAVNGNIQFTGKGVDHVVDIAGVKNTVLFERHFNVSAQILTMSPRVEYLAFMAWTAARSDGLDVPAEFDDFLDVVEDLSIVDQEDSEAANPTDGGQSAEL